MAQDWTGNDQLRDKFDKLEALNAQMLEALKAVVREADTTDPINAALNMWAIASAAIARAEAQP
jgi:hypothetical protein